MAVQAGPSWKAPRAAHSETAKAVPAITHRTGTTRESSWIRTIRIAFSLILSTSGLQRARVLHGTIPLAVIRIPGLQAAFRWTSMLALSWLGRLASCELGMMAAPAA